MATISKYNLQDQSDIYNSREVSKEENPKNGIFTKVKSGINKILPKKFFGKNQSLQQRITHLKKIDRHEKIESSLSKLEEL